MNTQNAMYAQNYLYEFDQILNQMKYKMLSAKIIDNITLYFIECMIPHHQAAIYMCNNLLKYTNFTPLTNIAKNIIKMQTRGIEQMQEIAKTTTNTCNIPANINSYTCKYLEITKNMISQMKSSPRCNNINLDFMNEMIPHHKGALELCNNLLNYYIDPRLTKVAKSIIEEQSKGIKELEQTRKMLCNNYN